MALLILNLGTGWKFVAIFTPRLLCPRKEPQYPFSMRLGGPPTRFEWFRRREKSLASFGIRTLDRPTRRYTDYDILDPKMIAK
jgi:hypothetical protein